MKYTMWITTSHLPWPKNSPAMPPSPDFEGTVKVPFEATTDKLAGLYADVQVNVMRQAIPNIRIAMSVFKEDGTCVHERPEEETHYESTNRLLRGMYNRY